jgi:hypothetical protein
MIHELAIALIVRNSTPPCNVVRPGMTTLRYCPMPSYRAPLRYWHGFGGHRPHDILLTPFYPGSKPAYIIG